MGGVAQELSGGEGDGVEVFDQRPGRVLDDLPALPADGSRNAVEVLAAFEPFQDFRDGPLAFSRHDGVDAAAVLPQAPLLNRDGVGAADAGEDAPVEGLDILRRLARLAPSECRGIDSGEIGPEAGDGVQDLGAGHERAVVEPDFVAG